MREIHRQLSRWGRRRYALATVVDVHGSAPLPVGSALAVDTGGAAVGGISGGCVEGAVYELCREVLTSGVPVRQSFGYADPDGVAVGLTCGGTVDVLVTVVDGDPAVAETLRRIGSGSPVTLGTVVAGPGTGRRIAIAGSTRVGGLGDPALEAAVEAGAPDVSETAVGDSRLLIETFGPPPRLIVFGAVDFAAALTRAAKLLEYHVTVCDARAVFATRSRFPDADEVVVDWPHRYLAGTDVDSRTAICVLTHDAKFDVPVLRLALRSPAVYVGAMGSRRTHADRLDRLRRDGVTDAELARLRAPIGLDLRGRTAAETALSILAEIVAVRRHGSARFLSETDAPIHAIH